MSRKEIFCTINTIGGNKRIVIWRKEEHNICPDMNPSTSQHGRDQKDSRVVRDVQEREHIGFLDNGTTTANRQKRDAGNLARDNILDSKKQRMEEKQDLLSSSLSDSYPISSSVPYSTSIQKNFSLTSQSTIEYSDMKLQSDNGHCSDTHCDVYPSLVRSSFDYNGTSIEERDVEAENADECLSSAISSASSVSSFQCPPAPPTTPIIDVNSTLNYIPRKNSAAFHDVATPKPLSASVLPQLPADEAMEIQQSAQQSHSATNSISEQEKYTQKSAADRTGNALRRRQYQLSNDFDSWKVGPRYELMRILGKGSYGEVAQAKDLYHPQEGDHPKYVAIKKIATSYEQDVDALHSFREIHLLRRLKGHDCIIQLIDVVAPESEHSIGGDIYLVFECEFCFVCDILNSVLLLFI